MALCWRVFCEFESGITCREGMESFSRFINDDTLYTVFLNGGFPVIAAYHDDVMVGVAAVRSGPHLSLLDVGHGVDPVGQLLPADGRGNGACRLLQEMAS